MTATNGLMTRVETTVAMALALSCHPFEKSNSSANTTTTSSIPVKFRHGAVRAIDET